MKMRALKDFLDPYLSVVHVVGTKFDLNGDDDLCEFLVGMGTLEYAEEDPAPEPEPTPVKSSKPAPTKAELSSGVNPNG